MLRSHAIPSKHEINEKGENLIGTTLLEPWLLIEIEFIEAAMPDGVVQLRLEIDIFP